MHINLLTTNLGEKFLFSPFQNEKIGTEKAQNKKKSQKTPRLLFKDRYSRVHIQPQYFTAFI